MIHVTITHIGQSLDLSRKTFDHTIKLQLPDGQLINATVDERSVEMLMKFVAGDEQPAVPDTSPPDTGAFSVEQYQDQPAHVFGGIAAAPVAENDQMVLPIPAATTSPSYPQPSRMKTVPKDEYGYPIVSNAGMSVGALQVDDVEDDGVPAL